MPIEKHYKKFFATTLLPAGINKLLYQQKNYSGSSKVFLSKLCAVLSVAILFCFSSSAQTTLINPATGGGFESGATFALNGWTTANGPNAWQIGTAAVGYSGTKDAFIGPSAISYSYNPIAGVVSHFYMDVTVPASQSNLTLSFRLKVVGNANCTFFVYDAPAGTVVAANSLPAGWSSYLFPGEPVGGYNTSYAAYTTITLNYNSSPTGTRRIIFTWKNNNVVNPPPAAIDDISLVADGCASYSGTGFVSVASIPYSSLGRSTCGKVDDFTSANTYTCGGAGFLGGEDEVFQFVAPSTGFMTITMSNASTTSSIMWYDACPSMSNPTIPNCIAYNQSTATSKTMCASVTSGTTYYVLVDASSGCYSYDISMSAPVAAIANDIPCGATNITLGTIVNDDNTCAGGSGEPATPACWTPGIVNSLWYSFTAPASGQVHVSIIPGSLITAQIELFSGSCGTLTSVVNSCKDYNSLRSCPISGATYTGLTPGAPYFIRLDGYNTDVGSYGIGVEDNSGTLAPVSADCNGAIEICGVAYSAPANSLGCGNVVDFTSGTFSDPSTNPNCCNQGCLLNGELNPRWYRINISTSGTLAWTLTSPGAGATGFYDWEMWNITNSSCAAIDNNNLAPIRCNWNGPALGMTGMQSTIPAGGSASNFETPLAVNAGDTYLLCQTNWSGISTASYSYDFSNSTCTFGGTISTWNGYGGTAWNTLGSWSGCNGVPTCSLNGIINSAASQPVISANASVKDLVINSGASVTINAGVTLTVCGNFTNNGTLNVSPTSTILFNGTGTQTVSGAFTGTNKLGNVTVTKNSGSVVLNANVDMAGNFTTSSNTSILNANGKYIKLAGNFINFSGSTTYLTVGAGTIEFNGVANQNYTPGGALTLNNVMMNQSPASSVTLNATMTVGGTLTLTSGRISTGINEVNVTNSSVAGVTTGNVNSYVDGNLRRAVNATGSYDFPVGQFSSGKGYQRANINFTTASDVTNLLAKFQAYAVIPVPLAVVDCGNTYNMPALDNGYWTISSTPAMSIGQYTTTLYNTAGTYTNSAGATNWTVMKDDGSGWALNGTCAGSTVNVVTRTGMSGFSDFGTAQSASILPIVLTSFTGAVVLSGNWLQWNTSSELNNDYFIVEKSADAVTFSELAKVQGAGTSKEQHSYEAYDFNPVNGMNYYRLRQVNFDGHTTYSDMVALRNYSQSAIVTSVHPNPTSGDVHIEVNMPVDAVVKVEVLDIFGAVLNSFLADAKSGSNSIPALLNAKESGIYLLRITCDDVGYSYQTKVVKY